MAKYLPHNIDPAFVGIARIKAEQHEQLKKFEDAASRQKWKAFNDSNSHYDWWMFPIDSRSQHGLKWSVYTGDIEELKQDPAFLRDYRRGVELLMAAWGWDMDKQNFLPNPVPDQKWQDWPVRLYKVAYSLWLFGYKKEFSSVRKYAMTLIERGENMNWNGKDLGVFFTQGSDPYSKKSLYAPNGLD